MRRLTGPASSYLGMDFDTGLPPLAYASPLLISIVLFWKVLIVETGAVV